MSTHWWSFVLSIACLTLPFSAEAQVDCQTMASATPPVDLTAAGETSNHFYHCLRDRQLVDSRSQIVRRDRTVREHDFSDVRLNDPGLFQPTGISQASRFTAALNTQLTGVEAGVSVAPARFFEVYPTWLGGLNFTAAAVEGRRFRAGMGYTIELSGVRANLDTIIPAPTEAVIEGLRQSLDDKQHDFVDLCLLTVFEFPADTTLTSEQTDQLRDARLACGFVRADAARTIPNLERAISLLLTWRTALTVVRSVRPAGDTWATRVDPGATERPASSLQQITFPDPLTGSSDAAVSERLAQFRAEHSVHRIAINFDLDMFDQILGFTPATQPKCASLPAGMTAPFDSSDPTNGVAQWRARSEYAWRRERTRFTFGMGLVRLRAPSCTGATEREIRSSEFEYHFEPSFSWSYDLLTPWSVRGALRPENPYQAAAPRLTMGLETSMQVNLGTTSASRFFDRIRVTPYLGVQVSASVGFRVAIPLTGDVAIQAANASGGIAARSDLQWRLPLFLTTIIKLQ